MEQKQTGYGNVCRLWNAPDSLGSSSLGSQIAMTEKTVRRTIMVVQKIDKKLTMIRSQAMSRNNSYSYGRVLNCAVEYAIQKGFDQESLKKTSEELD